MGPDVADAKCQVCQQHFSTNAELQQHLHACVNDGRTLKVMVLRLTDEQVLALSKPHSGDSQIQECQLRGKQFESADLKCTSDKCSQIFSSFEKLQEQLIFSCDLCEKQFTAKDSLKRHIHCHNQLRLHACDVPGCPYSTKLSSSLHRHKTHTHGSILYTCMLCSKTFKGPLYHKTHMAKHVTGTPGVFKCLYKKCKYLFNSGENSAKTLNDLQVHYANSHTPKDLTCCFCNMKFKKRKSFLRRHVQNHMGNTRGVFKCMHRGCYETFSVRNNLRTHIKQLHKKKNYQCVFPDCVITSTSRNASESHWRSVHSNCQLCGRSFVNQKHLRRHMISHEIEEFKGLCLFSGCRKKFTSAFLLVQHAAEHSGEQFNNDLYVARHIERVQMELGAVNSNLISQKDEQQVLVCQDKIEEVVFD